MWVFLGTIIVSVIIFVIQYIEIYNLKDDNEIHELTIKELTRRLKIVKNISDCEINKLREEINFLYKENQRLRCLESEYRYQPQLIPKETLDAVKYAMRCAHPDNGGNKDDFIKFRKVYEELSRK